MPLDIDIVGKKLLELGARLPCHRCGSKNFVILDDYSHLPMHKELSSVPNMSIPVILAACANCGAITPHALGALGMLPPKKEENPNA